MAGNSGRRVTGYQVIRVSDDQPTGTCAQQLSDSTNVPMSQMLDPLAVKGGGDLVCKCFMPRASVQEVIQLTVVFLLQLRLLSVPR